MATDDPRNPDKKQPAATAKPIADEASDLGVDDASGAEGLTPIASHIAGTPRVREAAGQPERDRDGADRLA